MTVLEKERIEARPEAPAPKMERRRLGWMVWAIAVVAVAAVVAVGIVVLVAGEEAVETAYPPAADWYFTAEELTLMRLENEGLIPEQSFDEETVLLERLANRGLIPVAAVPAVRTAAPPAADWYFTPDELTPVSYTHLTLPTN